MRRFSGFKAVKSTVSILFLLGLCLSCVRADDEATFVVLQHYLNPTCTSNSDPNGGIPVAIYQNGFCYKGPPGEDAYSYKFDSTTFQTFSGTSCEGLPSRSEEIKNGDCMQADNSNIYNLDHLKLLNTNLAANTFDMTSQDLVSGKCKTAPGGDVYQNKIWDIRRYSKCYAKDGYQTYHTIKFGDGNTYLVGKIFDKPYCKGTYTTNLMPMDSCFPLLEDQSPDSWINIHNNSGALDHFMNVYYDLDASHFPFKNQTFPAPTPPEPMPSDEVSQDKEWVHKKAFKDDQCVNENVAEYEQLYEVGRCYKMSYVNMSEAFLKDDNDELGYYWYNETSDCDASPSVQLPLEADLDISCSPLYKNYTIKMVKPEAIDPDNRGLGVVVVKWPQNSDCDSKDPGYMFSFLPADTCLLDYEDTSFILSQTDAVSMTKVHYKTDGCSGEVDYTVPYHYKTCNPQPDGSSFMAFNPATAANDLLDYFPGSTVEDFPLKGLPPVAAKTWTAITFTTDQGCTQEQGRMIIAENNLCYDIGDSIMLTGTEFKTYQGPGCSEDKLNASIPMNKGSCIEDPYSRFFLRIEDPSVSPNAWNVTYDVIVSNGCDFYNYETSFSMENFHECYLDADPPETIHPLWSDGSKMLVSKKFDSESGCTGNYTIEYYPLGQCYQGQDEEVVSYSERSGALDTFMDVFSELDKTLFPFMNQSYPDPIIKPTPGPQKEWIHWQPFSSPGCQNGVFGSFLVEVGACKSFFGEDDNTSTAFSYYSNELYYAQWNGSECEGPPLTFVPIVSDLNLTCSPVTGMQNDFTSYKAESFDAEEYGALAIFFEDSSCSKQGVSHFQGFETDTCLQSGDDRSMLMTANSSGVTVHEYSDSDCTILDGDSGGYFEYKECVVTEEGGAGIMGIHPSAATEDLMDIFGGSASDYPFIPTSPPPPPPPSGSKTWTHLQYLADPMCLQSNEPYGTPDRIFENGFCYADHAGNSFKVTPEKMEYYTGDDCQSQNTKSTHILADGDCFLDEAYGFGHVKIVNSTVDPNTFNVTSDVVGSNYCQYDSESRVHFATLKYYECYHAYGYAKFSPMIEDFKQYLLIRSYSEQENVNCDGGQYVKTRYPFGECHTEADDEYDTWFMTSPSGALDAFMEEFSTTDETLFPFMNQTFPPAPPPVPSPPAEKEWVFVKHFRDENCTDASTEDFEQLLEVGLCYTEEETSHSILYDHGELSFYEWNATNCTGLLREQNPFGSDVNMTCSILNPGMQFKTFGAESLNATQGGALALEFFGDTCEMAPDKYTYHFYDINVCIASDDEEDNYSFILTTNSSGVFSQTFRDLTCHTPTTPEDYAGPHAFLFKNCTPTGDGKSLIGETSSLFLRLNVPPPSNFFFSSSSFPPFSN